MRAIRLVFWTSIALLAATLMGCAQASTPMTTDVRAAQLTPAPSVTVTPQPPSPTSTSTAVATSPAPTPIAEAITSTPKPVEVDLSSFAYVSEMGRLSPTQGWILTDSLSECGANPGCRTRLMVANGAAPAVRLLWTEDAGESWTDITPAGLSNCPPPDICTIAGLPVFLDSSRARIAVVRGQELMPPTTLSYMHTENGGKTWGLWNIDELEYGRICPGHGCLAGVDLEFSDPLNGWLSASASLGMHTEALYLYRTQDGGQSWTPLVKSSTGDSGGPGWTPTPIIHQLNFINSSTGWAVAGWRWDTGTLLATSDGASSWRPMSLDAPDSYAEMGRDHLDPIFFSRASGVLPVRFYQRDDGGQRLGFYATEDGGETWSLTATLEDSDMDGFGSDLAISWSGVNETTWFVTNSGSKQYLTRDRGRTWEAIAGEGLGDFDLIETQFVSEIEGWGLAKICESGVSCAVSMFATHDGGRTWSPIGLSP